MEKNNLFIRIHCLLLWIILPLTINCHRLILISGRDSLKSIKILDELLNTEEVGTPNYAMITHSYSMLMPLFERNMMRKKISDVSNHC